MSAFNNDKLQLILLIRGNCEKENEISFVII